MRRRRNMRRVVRYLSCSSLLLGAACARPPPTPSTTPACPVVPAAETASAASVLVPPPRPPPEEADAGAPPPWTPAPSGASIRVFRETIVGEMRERGQRTDWTLIMSGKRVLLRMEERRSTTHLPHLDRASMYELDWGLAERSEASGTASADAAPFAITLKRTFGRRVPEEIGLTCATRTISVHPAFATLVEGWKRMDDSMEPASWAPARFEKVPVLGCKIDGGGEAFTDGLSFAKPRPATAREPSFAGVDWAFVDSDMVIQEGGYRWIPDFDRKP